MELKTFDELLAMSPQEIEMYRKATAREYIRSLPEEHQHNLMKMQDEIDSLCKNHPDNANVLLQHLMVTHTHKLGELVTELKTEMEKL